MHSRSRCTLVAAALLSVLTGAVADVVPRYNNCPRGYYPDGNYCISRSDRPYQPHDYGPPPNSPPEHHFGGQSYQHGPPIIEKQGNCPPGYHSNRKGKKCVRDGYED